MERAGSERALAEEEPRRPPPDEQKRKATGRRGGRSAPAPPPEGTRTAAKRDERWEAAKREFVRAAIADAQAYTDMTVEEVIEEYRRAGKLHRYDPDTEWMKRYARVARKHPPPEGLVPKMGDYLKLLEEDEEAD